MDQDTNKVYCPFCKGEMNLMVNLRAYSAKAYYLCRSCYARSPRVSLVYVEDFPRLHVPHVSEARATIKEIGIMARDAAISGNPVYAEGIDPDSVDFDSVFENGLELEG